MREIKLIAVETDNCTICRYQKWGICRINCKTVERCEGADCKLWGNHNKVDKYCPSVRRDTKCEFYDRLPDEQEGDQPCNK